MDKSSLKRSGQVLAPSLFTFGNMACGFSALLFTHLGDFTTAGTCILGGIVFDMLDGRIARLVHGESTFGVELDSLADFLSFGVAPAYMMYALLLKDYGLWGGVCALLFAVCGGVRLARFNAMAHAGVGSKSHFTGLPIPGAAGFLASFVLLYQIAEQQDVSHPLSFLMNQVLRVAGFGPGVVVLLAYLMVSTIPYGAFKQVDIFQPQNRKLLVVVVVVLGLLYLFPQNALFLLFLTYVVSGLTGLVLRRPDAHE